VKNIEQIKGYLAEYIARSKGENQTKYENKKNYKNIIHASATPGWSDDSHLPALETIRRIFGLSEFERTVLILCIGVELDTQVAWLCAKAQGDASNAYPTFGLALAALPEAHWSALTPASPLRRFQLIDLHGLPSTSLTSSPLKVEERVLHYLTGISYLEKQLQGLLRPVHTKTLLAESHTQLIRKLLLVWNRYKNDRHSAAAILWGAADKESKLEVARSVCADLGLGLWQTHADLLPSKSEELESFIRLWTRESALFGAGLYIDAEGAEPATLRIVKRLADDLPGALFVGTRERFLLEKSGSSRGSYSLEVRKPEKGEQHWMWKLCLGKYADGLEGELGRLVGQFDLNSSSIQLAAEEALLSVNNGKQSLFLALWESSQTASRPRMSDLATHIVPKSRIDDLVLPENEKELLREIAFHVRQRDKVYRDWGWNTKSARGLGIAVLFAGESGTGKTMAAEVLANELNLDLFRIDLSSVVSKYIGETEKNLRRVFDAAEDGGAILFFDEAEALFGKRSEVHDSHDRYANIEVGYLLQRMETYRGLAILATNMKNAIDTSFLRRLRFVVNFPFPDEKSRVEIWSKAFPESTPVGNLNYDQLAKLNITGGSIRNIALNACFLAAEQGTRVKMDHIKQAAKIEYDKMERPLTKVETGEW
jgi:AAA+ superfamily predicted ATPase